MMISKYEYWAHRLFPKMKFVDVIEKLEKLGEKREVKNKLNTLRLGGDGTNEPQEDSNDPAIEDEMMTERVMNMMSSMDSSKTNRNSGVQQVEEDEEDEDELFNRLLASSNY